MRLCTYAQAHLLRLVDLARRRDRGVLGVGVFGIQ
jgi:hypothetical protein